MAGIAAGLHGAAGRSMLARAMVGLAALGLGSTAMAGDPLPGALFGAGAGAIIGHSVGGSDVAIVGGIIGAVTGAAIAAGHGSRGVAVHYNPGYGYAPPVIVFVPGFGHGFWRHGVDAWGRPLRIWVPAARPRGYYAPAPHRHHHHRHDRGRRGHGHRW